MAEEKFYRVKTKEGAHINEKLKDDGSRAAIQFDNENGLQGPVDLIEVDESEYTKEVYVEVERRERSFGQAIVEDAVVPAISEALSDILIRATEAGINAIVKWMSQKVFPAAKAKGSELIDRVFNSRGSKEKDQQADEFVKSDIVRKDSNIASPPLNSSSDSVIHTQDEVDQILNNMKFASLYIAAGIRELSNTVIVDDGSDPKRKIEFEAKLHELSSEDVMKTIEFMLEDGNRDVLDQATIQLFEAFRQKDFIVEGEVVPISRYLTAISQQ